MRQINFLIATVLLFLLENIICVVKSNTIDEWMKLADTYDEETASIVDYITKHQNPQVCDDKTRYLISEYWTAGIGAVFHVISNHLSHAMRLGRVLIFHPKLKWMWTEKRFCGVKNMSPDCYLLPYSHCQTNITEVPSRDRCCHPHNHKSQSQYMHIRGPRYNDTIPIIPGPDGKKSYTGDIAWWRAVSTRYLFRPNSRLMRACQEFLVENLVYLGPKMKKPEKVYPNISPPPAAIGIHIRHGDKKIESKLHEFKEYLDAAEIISKENNLPKSIILSTDNEKIIEEIENNPLARQGFTFYYTKFTRLNDWGSPIQTAHKAGVVGFIINSFANLIIGTHPCIQGFVQTTSSNWNRLINEIRRTDGKRANAPSIDLEYGEN